MEEMGGENCQSLEEARRNCRKGDGNVKQMIDGEWLDKNALNFFFR